MMTIDQITNKLFCEDCLEVMKQFPDESIDMILCDLPYGETGNSWDSMIPLNELMPIYERLLKKGGCIALTGTMRFGMELVKNLSHLYKYDIVWEKEVTNIPKLKGWLWMAWFAKLNLK